MSCCDHGRGQHSTAAGKSADWVAHSIGGAQTAARCEGCFTLSHEGCIDLPGSALSPVVGAAD